MPEPADHGGHDAAGAGAGDHAGQQVLLVQRLAHADVEHAQRGAAGELQRGLAEAAQDIVKTLAGVAVTKPVAAKAVKEQMAHG